MVTLSLILEQRSSSNMTVGGHDIQVAGERATSRGPGFTTYASTNATNKILAKQSRG